MVGDACLAWFIGPQMGRPPGPGRRMAVRRGQGQV